MKNKLVLFNDSWVKPTKPEKLRVAMCEIYPDSAPNDWMLRLRHWHIPAAISPLHDKDTYDSDKKTVMYKIDDKTKEPIYKNGEPVPCTDSNGEIVYEVHHVKGEYKKPHYHVMIAYGNATTPKTFMKIIDDIGGVVPPWEHMEVCSVMSMYRYFAHLDDHDKYQYDPSDIVLIGGFDPVNYQTYADKNEPFNDVLKLLKNHKEITSYRSLCEYYRGRDSRLFYFCCNHTLALNKWFTDKK